MPLTYIQPFGILGQLMRPVRYDDASPLEAESSSHDFG